MFTLLKLSAMVLLKTHKITDKNSCRVFLHEWILLTKSLAAETETQVDDAILQRIEFIISSDALYAYIYQLIFEQFQTPEILFEPADAEAVSEFVEKAEQDKTGLPKAVNPAVIVSLITKFISIINAIKNQ